MLLSPRSIEILDFLDFDSCEENKYKYVKSKAVLF